MTNILTPINEKNFILTQFYYPSIGIENKKGTENYYSLRMEADLISTNLKEINKKNKQNIIEILDRSNAIFYLLTNKEINKLKSLDDNKTIELMVNLDLFPNYFNVANQIYNEPNANNYFFYTRNMYSDDHQKKTLEKIKKKENFFDLNNKVNLFSKQLFRLHIDIDEYSINYLKDVCKVLRKNNSLKLDCPFYPLKLLDQNIEINFYY